MEYSLLLTLKSVSLASRGSANFAAARTLEDGMAPPQLLDANEAMQFVVAEADGGTR